jgi:hypothetical protein
MVWRSSLPVVLLIAFASGCGSSESPSATPVDSTARASSSTVAPAAAPAALDFSAPTVGGETLDLRAYAGMNVAFWFWAPY